MNATPVESPTAPSRPADPAVGAQFESSLNGAERRQSGAHYTSERDILKLIRPLFLEGLRTELDQARNDPRLLTVLHRRIAALRILDPACGCGDFLRIAYRELRLLELEILEAMKNLTHGCSQEELPRVSLSQFHGIEIDDAPARLARQALEWTAEAMDRIALERLGATAPRGAANLHIGNALQMDWNEILPSGICTHIVGNPPFVGAKFQTDSQRQDLRSVSKGLRNAGLLDYAAGWFLAAADYLRGTRGVGAFVVTNSIVQGEQAGFLWPELFRRGVTIHFAHRPFPWTSESEGKARVHVAVIGFGAFEPERRILYDAPSPGAEPVGCEVRNISPYLVEGPDLVLANRTRPLCEAPEIRFGNQPIDGGHLLLDEEDRLAILSSHPEAERWIRRYVGAEDFLNGGRRYCLWLVGASMEELRAIPAIAERLKRVREFRLQSRRAATRDLANSPVLFAFRSHPNGAYLFIPAVSSERRDIIPIGFLDSATIASNAALIIPNADHYHFGVLTSEMHMAWVRQVCGRLESRYRYSNKLVYNNFPWPENPTEKQKAAVEEAAHGVLAAREAFPDQTLADLYDPLTMPKPLREAHKKLDRAVDRCYRKQPFDTERQRVEYLFGLYSCLIGRRRSD